MGIAGIWCKAGPCEVHLIGMPRHDAFGIDDYTQMLEHLKQTGLALLETNPDQGQMWS